MPSLTLINRRRNWEEASCEWRRRILDRPILHVNVTVYIGGMFVDVFIFTLVYFIAVRLLLQLSGLMKGLAGLFYSRFWVRCVWWL